MRNSHRRLSGTAITSCVRNITSANKAPGGFGLGDVGRLLTPEDNLDEVKVNGWYRWERGKEPKGTLPVSVGQSSYATCVRVWGNGAVCYQECANMTDDGLGGCLCVRIIYGSTIFPWGWDHPPMELGVEYRTTERYLGKPVYCKVVDCGKFPAPGTSKLVAHGISNCYPVSITARMSNGNTVPFVEKYAIGADGVNIFLFSQSGVSDQSANTVMALMRYTKTTDGLWTIAWCFPWRIAPFNLPAWCISP